MFGISDAGGSAGHRDEVDRTGHEPYADHGRRPAGNTGPTCTGPYGRLIDRRGADRDGAAKAPATPPEVHKADDAPVRACYTDPNARMIFDKSDDA
jgi:hypothetical protein